MGVIQQEGSQMLLYVFQDFAEGIKTFELGNFFTVLQLRAHECVQPQPSRHKELKL